MRFVSNILRPLLGVVVVLGLATSCKKKEGQTAGIDVQPNENRLGLLSTDTFTVEVQTKRLDSVRTDLQTKNVLGSLVDPVFGKVENAFVSHVRLSSENIDINKLRSFKIDSVVLALVHDTYYGDLDAQTFEVYEVNEDLLKDSAYYSNHNLKYTPNKVGELANKEPNPTVKFKENDKEQPAQLRIPLDSAFGRKLFDAPALAYTSNDEFVKEFKGLYVKVNNTSQNTNEGALLGFNLLDPYSRLLVYYEEPDGSHSVLEYLINDKSKRFNLSNYDYSGTDVGNAFDNLNEGKNKLFVQAMGGTVGVLKVPNIKSLAKNGKVLINKAQFRISVETGSNSNYAPLLNLYLFGIKEDNKIFDTPDRKEPYFTPKITSDLKYNLTVTRYFQQVLDGQIEDNGLMLMDLGSIYGRSVINGTESNVLPLKFVVSYTPIN